MLPIPVLSQPIREHWPDEDFDLPDGDHPIAIHSADDDDHIEGGGFEDWDAEFSSSKGLSHKISPPPPAEDELDKDVSTIKVSALSQLSCPLEDDMEVDLELPGGLSQLSLRPLHHRASKSSLEWEERENTPSSCSTASLSEPYSSLGLNHTTSPSSTSSHSHMSSQAETETDDDQGEGDLDGLVLPSSIFGSRNGGKELARILDVKKNLPVVPESMRFTCADEETDFEAGLVINDDVDLSPSRLLMAHNQQQLIRGTGKAFLRSRSNPSRPSSAPLRTSSRLRSSESSLSNSARPESPALIQTLKPSKTSSGRLRHTVTVNASNPVAPQNSRIRTQKSISGLKAVSTPRGLGRKASLSSLIDNGSDSSAGPAVTGAYNSSTAASRAKVYQQYSSVSRLQSSSESTSASSSGSLRALSPPFMNNVHFTLPSPVIRTTKHRRPISSVFPSASFGANTECRTFPSDLSIPPNRSRANTPPSTALSGLTSAKVLRRPRRTRLYGDGSELDSIDDLPTDGDKESRFRVIPKHLPTNRVPGGSYSGPSMMAREGSAMRGGQKRKDPSSSPPDGTKLRHSTVQRRKARLDGDGGEHSSPNKPSGQAVTHARRKPTLIRNLSGAGGPKVIGEMRWNPQSLRWEGNEQILRDFDAVTGSSTRPALITHLTGSSVGTPKSGLAAGARVVGNMIFDPVKMCWLSRLPPEEDEPDVFADIADDTDEHDDEWESKGGTIRASSNHTRPLGISTSRGNGFDMSCASGVNETSGSSSSQSGRMSDSESELQPVRGGRPTLVISEVDDIFIEQCRSAEVEHNRDISWWFVHDRSPATDSIRRRLYYIRDLATRTY